MITNLRIQNYKALRDVSLELTPIHVLIGPNDCGKTSILEAIAALSWSVDHPLNNCFGGDWSGTQLVWRGSRDSDVALDSTIQSHDAVLNYNFDVHFKPGDTQAATVRNESVGCNGKQYELGDGERKQTTTVRQLAAGAKSQPSEVIGIAQAIHDEIANVHFYSLVPRMLSLPVALDATRRFRLERTGFGLAAYLDSILSYDREKFDLIEKELNRIYPLVKSIKLVLEPAYRIPANNNRDIPFFDRADGKAIYFEFEGAAEPIPASQVSDGMLLILMYLTILNQPWPPRLLLVEEPENGIHPKRLREVISILRELIEGQKHTQIVMTTHSPYVVDLFEPHEVTLCQKDNDGAVSVHRLSQSDKVRKQLDVFTLGEIWTGEGEESLTGADSSSEESRL